MQKTQKNFGHCHVPLYFNLFINNAKKELKVDNRKTSTYTNIGGCGISPKRLSPKGPSPLAKVHCTFANIPLGISPIGECPLEFRQFVCELDVG
jgi:hypothetical protein